MKKRIGSLALVLLLALALAPHAMAADVSCAVTGGNIYFDITTGTVTGADKTVTSADIPAEIYGAAVKAIGLNAFSWNDNLISVTIPTGVTTIGQWAFKNCHNLASVTLAEGLVNMEFEAFFNCDSLAEIRLPGTLTRIGNGVFYSCDKLGSLVIPDSVTELEDGFAQNCTSMETLVIGNGVTEIPDKAFWGNSALKSVTLGRNVKSMGEYAFKECGMESIRLPDGFESIGFNAFGICKNLRTVDLPGSVKSIGWGAFMDCASLTSLAIPNGVESLPDNTCNGCAALKTVGIPLSLTEIRNRVFLGCSALTDVYYGGDILAWSAIQVGSENQPLSAAALHLNSRITSAWAQTEVEKAAGMDLIPEALADQDLTRPITRSEFAAVAVKAYEYLTGTAAAPAAANPFTDTASDDVLKAYAIGTVTGTSATTFSPDTVLTREQCATMLTRAYKAATLPGWTLAADASFPLSYTAPAPFADDAEISGWARESVYFMAANHIINGVGDNKFAPRNTTPIQEAAGYADATREQALIITVRMVENLG